MDERQPYVRGEWTVEMAERLDAALHRLAGLGRGRARQAIRTGKVRVGGQRVLAPETRVGPGDRIALDPAAPNPARTEPLGVRLVYRDEHLLVIDKPAGLPTTPLPDGEEQTALHAAIRLCRGGGRPKVVHRLDRDTSGLLVFARSAEVARAFRAAFEDHRVRRVYRCVVAGVPQPPEALLSSMLVRDAGGGRRGSRRGTFRVRPARSPDPGPMPGPGKLAITRYRTVAVHGDRAALEVRLSTGRTHQIRIHLAEHGCPVLGERVYARAGGAPRLALHAARLGFTHPVTGAPLEFESPWPADLAGVRPRGRDW